MAANDTARRTHEALFPGDVSTLAVTDPELIEHFDNIAFDEIRREQGDLDTPTRLLTQMAALIAWGAPFVGYPRTRNAIAALDKVAPAPKDTP